MGAIAKTIAAAYAAAPVRELDVPEWGLTIYVRPYTIRQLSVINAAPDKYEVSLAVLEVCAKNADGGPAFDKLDIEEMRTRGIGEFDAATIDRVAGAILRLAGSKPITDEAVDDAEKK